MSPQQEAWLAVAAQAETQVAALTTAYEVGSLTAGTFASRSALTVHAANIAATKYADAAVAAWHLATTGIPTPALGLLPPRDEQERLVRAFATIAAHEEAISRLDRAKRVARSEPPNRGRRAYQQGLRARGVDYWRRIVHPKACEECASQAGMVHPIEEPFTDHPSCRCELAPAVPETWGDEVKARQLQLRKTTDTGVRLSFGLAFSNRERR